MSLPEIRTLLEAIERPGADCAPVDEVLDEHIGHVAARIADLTALKEELDAIRAHCAGQRPARACGIVQTLSRPASRRVRKSSHVRGSD
jgi:hypothetical protein